MSANSTAPPGSLPTGATVRAGLAAGVVLAPAFVLTDVLDAVLRPGYEPLRHWVSHRALGPYGWIGTTSLLVAAALLVLVGAGLAASARSTQARSAYPTTIIAAGVALAAAAVFPMDPSLGFPPGASPRTSVSGRLHDVAGPVFILALAVAAFLSRRFFRRLDHRTAWTDRGWITGSAVVAAFTLTSVLISLDYADVWSHAPSGLFERVAIYLGLAHISAASWRTLSISHGTGQTSRPRRPSAGPSKPARRQQRSELHSI